MTLSSRVIERMFQLPAAATRAVRVHQDLPVTTRDGIVLRTDHWEPRLPGAPTILIRTPYGRSGLIGLISGRVLAERGFHVILQSCRGTFGSGGDFEPMRHERTDGLDTVAWIERQPWFNGVLFTYGPSYLGFTQWAIAAEAGPALRGMLTAVTTSSFRDPTYAGGAYALDTILSWATLTSNQGGSQLSFLYKQNRSHARLRRALEHLPLSELDGLVTGGEVRFFQEWLRHTEPGDPYWADRAHDLRVAEVSAPVCMVGGWYDIFLPWQLRDYATLRAAGATPRLVIGSWTHTSAGLLGASMREAITWFQTQLNGGAGNPGGVRVHLGGADEWRDLPDWPPHSRSTAWSLRPNGELSVTPDDATPDDATPDDATLDDATPDESELPDAPPDRFTYDPADPTPSPGGALLTGEAGPVDNRAVEARPDVLVYTSPRLTTTIEAIGPVHASIAVRSSNDHFDIHLRICDVDLAGHSMNVSDGLVRVAPGTFPPDADGIRQVAVELWPMGYVFRRGHRIRVQLAGGAHPRYARNPGTGEPLDSAIRLQAVHQEIFHDAAHRSVLHLPH